jgi:drug/metabolite transporter superfamily protein YnfA
MAMLMIPEWFLAMLALIALFYCIHNWMRYQEYAAAGYILPCLYFFIFYFIFPIIHLDDQTGRAFVRMGVSLIFVDILIWRVVFSLRQHRKNKHA